ncbi:hypothetical protein B0H16DRAFT_1502864 [Mycena metata]|uniref:Uncharacterized protein n=1 Tax=Mycena metata TaxID=1033252 RepID=A0AAD7K6M2_9AGAR|nr:hypothetical protein B0H16DRAFT_1502864 [Mycena metata]
MENNPSPTAVAGTTSHGRHPQYNVNYYYARQLMPSSLTSSSYDYWWPYPPEGATATTSTSTTLPLYTSTDALFTSTSTPALALFNSASMASSSFAGSPSDSLSVTSMSSSTASSSPSESIISISALPPSNSTVPASSHHKLSMVPQSTLVYIVPACGVVGLLIGGITAWCVYGCLTRNGHGRRRGRKSYGALEVGPEYTQPSPRLGEKLDDGDEGEWVGDEKHAEESDAGEDTVQGDASDDECETGTETEGFLHPGSAQKRPAASSIRTKSTASTTTTYTTARTKSTRSSRGTSPTPSGRTSLFFDRPDSTDPLPWESLRHTSIKRGILERLRGDGRQPPESTGTDRVARRPWQAHGRHDSDLLIADAQADLSRAASSVTASSAALSRASTARSGPGFRILQESPAGTPQRERGADLFGWPSVEEDKYTRVPARVARGRSQSPQKASRANSPVKFERSASPDKLARAMSPPLRRGGDDYSRPRGRKIDIDGSTPTDFRNVLPQSPPRISSPVLDGALCFTPISSPSLERTPEMNSFASFGAPGAEEVVAMARMKRGTGGRAFRGAERPGRD